MMKRMIALVLMFVLLFAVACAEQSEEYGITFFDRFMYLLNNEMSYEICEVRNGEEYLVIFRDDDILQDNVSVYEWYWKEWPSNLVMLFHEYEGTNDEIFKKVLSIFGEPDTQREYKSGYLDEVIRTCSWHFFDGGGYYALYQNAYTYDGQWVENNTIYWYPEDAGGKIDFSHWAPN